MKYLLTLLTLAAITSLNAKELRPELPDYTITSDSLDHSISRWKSKFTFRVNANHVFTERSIRYAVDDKEFFAELDENNEFSFLTKTGEHSFMILLSTDFHEIITNKINIEPQHHMRVRLNFKSTTQQIMVRKPVIYLYPKEELNAHVTIDPAGELFFTYPEYNNGWDIVAAPSGELKIDGQMIDYLFWEAQMDLSVNTSTEGVVLPKYKVQHHITEVLDKFGLNDNEKADFLTYWVPEILQSNTDNIEIQFLFNQYCTVFGDLKVEPAPDHIGRIYLLWAPTEKAISDTVSTDHIPTLDRSGFTVIEWGGAELRADEAIASND